jgi:hypothetical protein
MRMTIPIGLTLLLASSMALAWQPVVYPIRGQSPSQQNVDAAMCYGMANKQTNVNTIREAQNPTAPKLDVPIAGSGVPQYGQPPLPASGVPAASGTVANGPAAASAAAGASSTMAAKGTPAMPSGAVPGSEASAQTAASGAAAASGASDGQTTTEAEMKLPPPPPPEPPMTRYWRAYGACMQQRGYMVQ